MKLKSLKLFIPPFLWNLIRNFYNKAAQSKQNIDNRRWWNGETIISNNYMFKKIFKNFDLPSYVVTLQNESRDCIEIKPQKKFVFEISEFEERDNIFLIGMGNKIPGQFLDGYYKIKTDNEDLLKLTNPSCMKWENFKISLNSKSKIEIFNNTKEILYFTCPTILEKQNLNNINNFVVIFLDQIDNDILQKMYDKKKLPFVSNFFKNSINFSNFYSSSEWTMPSLYSFFSGEYSSEHGLFDFNFSKNVSDPMKDDNLISFFKNKNFFNLGISRSKGHHPGFNFQKYFDRFYYFPSRRDKFREEDFEQIAIEHLESNLDGKNFIFLHYLSSHAPYYGNSINEDVQLKSERIGYPLKDYENSIIDIGTSKIEKVIDVGKIDSINQRRKERLKSLDLSLSKLLNFIQTKIHQNTMVLLTSDHGINHIEDKNNSYLSKDRINVPLKIYHPSIKKDFKIDEYYSSVDIFKLIKSLAKNFKSEDELYKNIHKNKNNEIFSESIFGNYYKATIISDEIGFYHICKFNSDNKTVHLNEKSKSKIVLYKNDKNLDRVQITKEYLQKIKEHLNNKGFLRVAD